MSADVVRPTGQSSCDEEDLTRDHSRHDTCGYRGNWNYRLAISLAFANLEAVPLPLRNSLVTRSYLPCLLALVTAGCGGAESANTNATTSDPPIVSEGQPATPTVSPARSPTETSPPSPSTAGSPTTSGNPEPSPGAPSVATTSGPFEPGTPVTLLSDLWFPARMAISDGWLYFADRPRLGDSQRLDEFVRVSLGTDTPTVERLFEAPSIDGFTVTSDTIWIASAVQNAFMAFSLDGKPGLALAKSTPLALSVAHNTHSVYFGGQDGFVLALEFGATSPTQLYTGREADVPQWFRATEDAVYAAFESGPTNQLVRIDARDGHAEILIERTTRLGGFSIEPDGIYFADAILGTIEVVPHDGGDTQVLASVPQPWSLLVEGDYLYVATQPDDYCQTGTEGDLRRVDRRDGSVVVLAGELPCPSMLAATSEALYWVNNGTASAEDGFEAYGDGSLMMLRR